MSLQSLVSDIKKKKTGTVDLSFMKNQPKAGMSMRPLPGATISKAPETRAPFTRIAEKVLPRGAFNQYNEMVAEPLAKVRKFIAPSFSDQMNQALKENPKATQKQLEERAKQLDEESGMARLNNQTSLDVMGTGGSMKNIGRALISKLTEETDRFTIAKTLKTEMPDHFTDVKTLANVSTKLAGVKDENEVQRIIDTVIKSKAQQSKLLSVHNLSEQKLRFAERVGGLANPSMAVIDPNLTSFESYGDISLIGDKDLIKGQKTHLADAYSPRFPSVHTTLKWDDYKQLQNDLQPFYDEIDQLGTESRKLQHEDTNMLGNIENSPAVALKFLKENGITPSKEGQFYYHGQIQKLGLDNKYQDFLDELYKKYNLKEQMFAGYTNAGKRRYKPVSVEEASKIMGKQKEEGFNYGLGSYRSKIAPIKTSAPAIRKEAGRLVTKEEFEAVKDSYDKELWDLKDKLQSYAKVTDSNSFIEADNQINTIGSVLSGERDAMSYFKNKYPDAPQNIVNEVFKFREKLKNMPTEYFETKFKRPVGLNEFKVALVPEDISPEALRILKDKGLRIVTYKKGQKQQEMQKLLRGNEAFGGIAGVEEDDEGNLKIDPLKFALGMAGMHAGNRINKLIAEGKVRVVSRNGKDTYQVKQGDTWITKRDEDSALKHFEPKSKKPGIQVDPKLEERLLLARIAKEALDENPIKELSKYVAKRGEFKGELGEATGKKAKSTIGHGYGLDQKVMDLGIEDTEVARKQYAQYRERVADNEVEIAEARDAIKQARQSEKTRLSEEKKQDALIDDRYTKSGISPKEVRSLEETANQLIEDLPLSPSEKPMSLKEIVTQTPLKGKVNLLDYIRTPDRVLKKIGFEKEAQFLRNQYEEYVKELPKNIDKITNWYKQVPKDAGERIFQWLDGKEVQLYGNELKVAREIRQYLKEWADRLNLPEDNRITNYITHIFEDQLVAKEFDEDLAKIIANKIPGEVYDPFLLRRLGAQGYKQDVWASLDAYVKRATRKVHLDPALEKMQDKAGASLEFSNLEKSQFDYIKNYVDRVNLRPTDLDSLLDTGFKQIFGYGLGQRPINRLSGLMRRLTYRGMLGLNLGSALRNLSQGVNTYATLGERDTFLGYVKLFSKENRDELEREGILDNNFIQDRALSSTKKLMEKADKGLWVFFDTAEKLNRGSAYLGAKTKGLRKGMPEKEAIQYAKNIVRKTQFNYDPVDTPVGLSSDLVKTLMQFQTYTTKQTEFLAELAYDRNFAGIARYGLAGLAFVYTIGQAFGMEPKELLPVYRFDTPPSLKFPAELTKALFNAPDKYGNERDFEQKTKDVAKTLWGYVPGGMQLKKTIQGLEANQEGGSYDASGKKQFEVGGSTLKETQSALFGKYASTEAKDYFDKGTGDKTFDTLKEKDNEAKATERKTVKQEVDNLRGASKEEVKARLLELAKDDKKMAEKVLDGLIEDKQNLSSFEKKLKESSVNVRAEYVAEHLAELDSPQEKKDYILNLKEKGILTESVLDRLIELKSETP